MNSDSNSITLLRSMVLLERTPGDTTIGALVLSSTSTTPRSSGTVLQLGPGVDSSIKVGDLVIIDTTRTTTLTINDSEYLCVDYSAIIGIVTPTGTIIPLGDRVLLDRTPANDCMGSLLLSESTAPEKSTGTILALGVPIPGLAVGDSVVFDKYGGTTLEHEGTTLVVVNSTTIIARINS